MPSATYDIFREAILNEKQVVFTYKDERRGACPIIIGHTEGEEKALTFQVEGASGRGWRCLYLSSVRDARLRDGPWHEGSAQHAKDKPASPTWIWTSTSTYGSCDREGPDGLPISCVGGRDGAHDDQAHP